MLRQEPTQQDQENDWVDLDLPDLSVNEEKSIVATPAIPADFNPTRFMTYNVACLPDEVGVWPFIIHKQVNGDFLRPNLERSQGISDAINLWNQRYYSTVHTHLTVNGIPIEIATLVNQFLIGPHHLPAHLFPATVHEYADAAFLPDIIAFEEAFDPKVRALFVETLKSFYPNHTDTNERKEHFWKVAGSGLLIFTKSDYQILDVVFQAFKVELPGEETIVDKGFLAIKVAFGTEQYKTIYATHLPGGGALFKDQFAKMGLTTSEVRGMALGQIHQHIAEQKWPEQPIAHHPELKNVGTYIMGDFNLKLNAQKNFEGISTGMSANGKVRGKPKYAGQLALAGFFKHNVPENFKETREEDLEVRRPKKPNEKIPKVYLEGALKEAKEKGLFIGSTMRTERLKGYKNIYPFAVDSTEPKVIDGIFASKTAPVDMRTRLSSALGDLSDHYVLFGCEEQKPDVTENIEAPRMRIK